jgi:hypothetical protein
VGGISAHDITPGQRPPAAVARAATVAPVPAALGDTLHPASAQLSVELLLQLQRTYGNVAVGGLVGARTTAVEPAPATVQRCGGELHEGCSCAQRHAPAASLDRGPTVEEKAVTVQRDGPDPAADKEAIPPDSPYAATDGALMKVFKESYRNNTMMFAHGPDETLVQVLDRIGMSAISIASEIYERMNARGIWSHVKDITWIWLTTSRGLNFNSTGAGLRSAVNGDPSFCKEFLVASMAYHGRTEMWRELVEPGTPGLHIGAGEEPAGVHIDMHQVAVPFGLGYCDYDPVALFDHWGDLQENGATVFSKADGVRRHAATVKDRIDHILTTQPEHSGDVAGPAERRDRAQVRLDAILPRLRLLATAGMEGEQEATAKYDAELTAIDAELSGAEADLAVATAPAGDGTPAVSPPDTATA